MNCPFRQSKGPKMINAEAKLYAGAHLLIDNDVALGVSTLAYSRSNVLHYVFLHITFKLPSSRESLCSLPIVPQGGIVNGRLGLPPWQLPLLRNLLSQAHVQISHHQLQDSFAIASCLAQFNRTSGIQNPLICYFIKDKCLLTWLQSIWSYCGIYPSFWMCSRHHSVLASHILANPWASHFGSVVWYQIIFILPHSSYRYDDF